MERVLITGNEVIAEAAIRAGCRYYFGYPITPQNELTSYMAKRMMEVGGTFIQAESEIGAINMVFGASLAGGRAMTSSSSPGISLKQEGISYLVGCELPGVIVNIMRGGPGLGDIRPSQSDYFQSTKGGGHGDYRIIVLAPSNLQEAADLTILAFDLADRYRNPVLLVADGVIGQMTEPVHLPPMRSKLPKKDWILDGCRGREPRLIRSLFLEEGMLERHNLWLQEKFKGMEREVRFERFFTDDAEFILVAFGTMGRMCRSIVRSLRRDGIKAGLIRPITLWPFPYGVIDEMTERVKGFFVVEMNYGQMVEDVRLAVGKRKEVHFYGRGGGAIPSPEEISCKVKEIISG